MSKFKDFKNIVNEFNSFKEKMGGEFFKDAAKELGEKYGNFAVYIQGYTPDFNDGEPCEHSTCYSICDKYKTNPYGDFLFWLNDACDVGYDDEEETKNFLEIDNENLTSINSHLADNPEFKEDISILEEAATAILTTNFIVKLKYKDGEVTYEHDDYDCGY